MQPENYSRLTRCMLYIASVTRNVTERDCRLSLVVVDVAAVNDICRRQSVQ